MDERTWSARSDVIQAAIAYEEAWTAYAKSGPRAYDVDGQLLLAKSQAHEELIAAIKALKEQQ